MPFQRLAPLLLCCSLLAACAQSVTQSPASSSPPTASLTSPIADFALPSTPLSPILVGHPRSHSNGFQAGVSLLVYGNDVSYRREASLLFDQLATDNVNSLSLVFPIFQSSYYATDIHTDAVKTPSRAELTWLITQAQSRGFTVMLRPLLDEHLANAPPGGWRGGIRPTSPLAWFASYDAVLVSYARLAQVNHVYAFDIGSELDTMERYTYEWPLLISRLRAVYRGALTYSSNFEARPIFFGHLLDFISVDAYYNVSSSPSPSIAQIIAGWQRSGLLDMRRRSVLAGRPVVVTEVGVWPANGVFRAPYGGSSSSYNPFDQQNFYTATCRAIKPSVGGIYWWYVGLTQQPLGHAGHDPLSVPGTDQAIASCYAPPFTYPPVPTPLRRHHMSTD